jgi:hypothetical protein
MAFKNVTIAGAMWGSDLILLLNPADNSKQKWCDASDDGCTVALAAYAKDRVNVNVDLTAPTIATLGV